VDAVRQAVDLAVAQMRGRGQESVAEISGGGEERSDSEYHEIQIR